MPRPLSSMVGILGAAAVGYGAGEFYRGRWSYAVARPLSWSEEYLISHGVFDRYVPEAEFTRLDSRQEKKIDSIFNFPGGMHPPIVYQRKDDPYHTVTFAYCGAKTCGHPFIIHGGVLGSLMSDAANVVRRNNGYWSDWKMSSFNYKKLSFVGQVLMIETEKDPNRGGITAVVKSLSGNVLAEGNFK